MIRVGPVATGRGEMGPGTHVVEGMELTRLGRRGQEIQGQEFEGKGSFQDLLNTSICVASKEDVE